MRPRTLKHLIRLVAVLLVATGVRAQQVEYYHLDALGSVRAISDANGAEIARYDYLPFGEEWNPTASADRLRFAGKERDTETGLDYLGARYLGTDDGRFRTVDPVMAVGSAINDPQQWNRYAYARNNPNAFIDPDGRIIESAWDAVSLGVGIASLKSNLQAGNYWSAALDSAGVVVDGAALLFPGVPGGVGAGIKLARGGDTAIDLARGGSGVTDLQRAGDIAADGPNRISSARELIRRAEEPGPLHNFPESFDQQIFSGARRAVSEDYVVYTQRGSITHPGREQLDALGNSIRSPPRVQEGTFEIGVRPSPSGRTEVITHRFFRPDP